MKTKNTFTIFTLLFLVIFLSLAYSQVENQTFYLNDGTKVTGKIIAQNDSTMLIETLYGTLEIQKIDIIKQEQTKQLLPKAGNEEIKIIRLKDGTTIKGKIISEDEDSLRVETAYGVINIPRSNVMRLGNRILPLKKQAIKHEPERSLPSLNQPQVKRFSDNYPTGKGSTMIGGLASFSITKFSDVDNTLTSLSIVPNIVHFVTNGVGLGFDMSLSWSSYEETSSTAIAIGPKFMFAFSKTESNVYPYIGFGYNYLSVTEKYEYYDYWSGENTTETQSTTGNIFKIGMGIMSRVGQNLVIPFEFGIVVTEVESEKMTIYAFSIGLAGFVF